MTQLEEIYKAYPRKVGRRAALLEIDRAVRRLIAGESGEKMQEQEAITRLMNAVVIYANSPAGQSEHFTPHGRTWFHQSRYLDSQEEWFYEKRQASASEQRAATTHSAIIDVLRTRIEQRNGNHGSKQQDSSDLFLDK
jgi:hypothetical protein